VAWRGVTGVAAGMTGRRGRLLLCQRLVQDGVVAHVAPLMGFSPNGAAKWWRRTRNSVLPVSSTAAAVRTPRPCGPMRGRCIWYTGPTLGGSRGRRWQPFGDHGRPVSLPTHSGFRSLVPDVEGSATSALVVRHSSKPPAPPEQRSLLCLGPSHAFLPGRWAELWSGLRLAACHQLQVDLLSFY
jgi:hypothetical protein